MQTVTSRDGTPIAFEKSGQGPAIVLVMGAFNDHGTGIALAEHLAQHFTVYNYDRRGRGESGDTAPYAVEREIEDIAALIDEAGGSAALFGYSSGAVLSVRAAAHGLPLTKLVLYDPPPPGARMISIAERLAALIAEDRRGDAVELYQTEAVGIPAEVVAQLRNAPFRPGLEKIAHTLVYDSTILQELPETLPASVQVSTLVVVGGKNPPIMLQSAQTLADTLPNAELHTLEGQTHDIIPSVLGPVLAHFLSGQIIKS
jgi:pimeloyl-ACP methyl ester carboxylesterase